MLHSGYWLFEFISISHFLRKAPVQYGTAFLHTETDENDLTYFIIHQAEIIKRALKGLHDYVARKSSETRACLDALQKHPESVNDPAYPTLRAVPATVFYEAAVIRGGDRWSGIYVSRRGLNSSGRAPTAAPPARSTSAAKLSWSTCWQSPVWIHSASAAAVSATSASIANSTRIFLAAPRSGFTCVRPGMAIGSSVFRDDELEPTIPGAPLVGVVRGDRAVPSVTHCG